MKTIYVPVYRTAVSYTVSFGKRWSVLEHLVLIELASTKRSLADLSKIAGLPERLIVEALINLMRANWIEVRSSGGVLFQATAVGMRRATEATLPPQVQTTVRWISLCVDRLTGTWLRAEDLDLVYDKDLPAEAECLEAKLNTYDHADGGIRELFKLNADETLEPIEPQFRSASRPFARIVVAFDRVERGLPANAPLSLRDAIVEAVGPTADDTSLDAVQTPIVSEANCAYDNLTDDDMVIGGDEHLALFQACLQEARSRVIVHSCFLSGEAIRKLLPEFEKAARRKVRVDLLWGLYIDPEDPRPRNAVADVRQVLAEMSEEGRRLVQLSPLSSGSHAKIILFDGPLDAWTTIVGSCNFLQSVFTSADISIRTRSLRFAEQILSRLISAQIPASGAWSPIARRLSSDWNRIHARAIATERGSHKLSILEDRDHYACVRGARNLAVTDIVMGCDIYGLAAETTVLVPMRRAVELGRTVRLFYQRPSKLLRETGRVPEADVLAKSGISLERVDGLHGKFLLWDNASLAVTSFNWLSTVVDGARISGAELGILAEGPNLRTMFNKKMMMSLGGRVDLSQPVEQQTILDLRPAT